MLQATPNIVHADIAIGDDAQRSSTVACNILVSRCSTGVYSCAQRRLSLSRSQTLELTPRHPTRPLTCLSQTEIDVCPRFFGREGGGSATIVIYKDIAPSEMLHILLWYTMRPARATAGDAERLSEPPSSWSSCKIIPRARV
nr:hypothetical protein CFP56_04362 [Quercus suber]